MAYLNNMKQTKEQKAREVVLKAIVNPSQDEQDELAKLVAMDKRHS